MVQPESNRYLRFTPGDLEHRHEAGHDYVAVTAPDGTQAYRLSAAEYQFASLFDGDRNADERRAAAAKMDNPVSAVELDRFTRDLAGAGLLCAGTEEPLPPPAQLADLDEGASTGGSDHGSGFPPSELSGSLAAPGRQGPVIGRPTGPRGATSKPSVNLPIRPFIGVGHALNATLYKSWLAWLPIGLLLVGLFGLWNNRLDATGEALWLLGSFRLLLVGIPTAIVLNFLTQAARAAAVQHYTGETPEFGLRFGFGFIPHFVTATEGAAERAERAGRVAIVASSLHAGLWVAVLAILGWFLSRNSGTTLPALCLGAAVVAVVGLLVRLNPLVRRDGYFLLAHWLNTPDLREQAWMSLFGARRPWPDRPSPPKTPLRLYAVAIIAYVVAVITLILLYPATWLATVWGGTGVAVFLLVMAAIMVEQSRRLRSGRGRIEGWNFRPRAPSRITWLLIVAFALLAMFPYTYSPSGPLEIIPSAQADVRAQISGTVRAVKVVEGERVQAGDILVVLADAQERAKVAAAKAKLKRLQAELALLKAGASKEKIALAQQRVATARERLQYARQEANRLETAYERNAVSAATYQKAAGAAAVQREQLAAAKRKLELVSAKARPKQIAALKAEIEAQKAQLKLYRNQLKYTRLRAPIDGRVVSDSLLFARGDFLERGEQIASIIQAKELLARVKMPAFTIGEFSPGSEADVKIWGYPATTFDGRVVHIAPVAEQGDYGKIIRVLVALGENASDKLQPGLTGQAKIEGKVYPAIIVFTRALARFLLVEVWSWLP